MAIIVLVSAAGSPGVTTAAVGLALTWPRPVVLVEADPTGGSAVLAGYFRGSTAPAGGLLDLVWADREGRLGEALPPLLVSVPGSTVRFLPGVRSHGQGRSLTGLWPPLSGVLHGLEASGQDVVVDGGRLGLEGWPEQLVSAADVTLLTVRSDLVSLAAARSWADTLRGSAEVAGSTAGLGLLLVGQGRPYQAKEIAAVLQLPVTATLAWDEGSAAVFARGAAPRRRFDRFPLPESLRVARAAVEAQVAARRSTLEPATAEPLTPEPLTMEPLPAGAGRDRGCHPRRGRRAADRSAGRAEPVKPGGPGAAGADGAASVRCPADGRGGTAVYWGVPAAAGPGPVHLHPPGSSPQPT